VFSSRSLVVARHGTKLLLADPAPFLMSVFMPVVLTAFLIPGARAQLGDEGYGEAAGSEQLIPGLAVLFAFVGTALIGTLFFREHAWGTWERLRASSASTLDIVVGKVTPLFVVQLSQMAVLFLTGFLLYDYRVKGSVVALVVVVVAFVAMITAYGVMLVAVFSTMDRALVVGNLGGMVMGGLGGALAPTSAMPGWLQAVAHLTPAYWALRPLREITLDGAGLRDVVLPLAVMAGFTLLFALVAALRFRPTDAKVGTT
jgi:ABC-2 type transport system permease protein